MQSKKWQDKKISWGTLARLLLVGVAILLIIGAAIIGVFIPGNMAITASILAATGVLLSVLQWLLPLQSNSSDRLSQASPISLDDRVEDTFLEQTRTEIAKTRDRGALVIFVTPKRQNKKVEILDLQTQESVASTAILRHTMKGQSIYEAHTNLEPGNYIVRISTADSDTAASAVVTLRPSQITLVDWRHTDE